MSYGENVRLGPSTQAGYAGQQEAMRNLGPTNYPQEKLANANTPASIIEVQMGHLESRIDVVQKLAAVIENRLARVLRQADSPNVKNSVGNTPCTGVIMGDALAMQCERLQDVINYLNTTIERIEL